MDDDSRGKKVGLDWKGNCTFLVLPISEGEQEQARLLIGEAGSSLAVLGACTTHTPGAIGVCVWQLLAWQLEGRLNGFES
jgi:hypothetical protein